MSEQINEYEMRKALTLKVAELLSELANEDLGNKSGAMGFYLDKLTEIAEFENIPSANIPILNMG
jgi:hypothetical protein